MAEVTDVSMLDSTLHSINLGISKLYKAEGTDTSWANASDETIAEMVALADQGKIDLQKDLGWAVGDARTVHLALSPIGGTFDGYTWADLCIYDYANNQFTPTAETFKTPTVVQPAQDITLYLQDNPNEYKIADSGKTAKFVVGTTRSLEYGLGFDTIAEYNATKTEGTPNKMYTERMLVNWLNGGLYQSFPPTLRSIFKKFTIKTAKEFGNVNVDLIESQHRFCLYHAAEVRGKAAYQDGEYPLTYALKETNAYDQSTFLGLFGNLGNDVIKSTFKNASDPTGMSARPHTRNITVADYYNIGYLYNGLCMEMTYDGGSHGAYDGWGIIFMGVI